MKHLPYISADLVTESSTDTISEWIERAKVQSPNDIQLPIHVLVISWAYSMNKTLLSLDKYTLNVITIDGDEKTLNILD